MVQIDMKQIEINSRTILIKILLNIFKMIHFVYIYTMYEFYESLSYDLLIQSNRNEKTLFAETRIHTRPFKLTESRRRAQFKTLFYHSPRTNRPLFHRQNDAKTFHFPKEKHNIEQQGFHTETGIMRATTFASHAPL